MKMTKLLITTSLIFIILGCSHLIEGIPGFKHTAFLAIGSQKNEVITQAEHLLRSKPLHEIENNEAVLT